MRSDIGVDVSRETLERLETYAALITRWSPRINLVARSTIQDLWARHIADSAQIFALAPPRARRWADLGSGGGLPGIVVATLAAELRPDLSVALIESDQRKAVFLRTAARECGLTVDVHARRIEEVPPLGADVISARALAALPKLLALAEPHLAGEAVCLFPKGATYREEIAAALETWTFHCEEIPSRTSPDGVILRLGEVKRA